MKESDKKIVNSILEKIKQYNKIIIHRHVNPDPDAIGSQVGLAEIISYNFPDKTVLTTGKGVEDFNFLSSFEEVRSDMYEDALVIVTDTANVDRIDGVEHYDLGSEVIKIDHHPLDDHYGIIEWVDTDASSCSEMIADFYLFFKDELEMPHNAARLLYGGIVGDTGRFQYPSTTPKTMRITAELMEYDFDHSALLNELYEMKPETAALTGYVLENLTVEDGVGSIIISQELMNELKIQDSDTSSIVSVPSTIQGVESWGIFVEQDDNSYRCRLRSKGAIINTIAKEHGGGGHPLASGAYAYSIDEIKEIISKFKKAVEDYKQKTNK